MSEHVVLGISGGVDSSVAAIKLLEKGYRVTALFMKNWDEDDGTDACTAIRDFADANAVCKQLDIPIRHVNFSAEYWDHVFENFLSEYAAGRTPNPDILCNKHIKFRAFFDHARELGADRIATGHYATILDAGGRVALGKARDKTKDQSYFLYTLNEETLAHCLFPLADVLKSEVRTIAARANFVTAEKKDSTGICFIGERRFAEFLKRYLPAQPGDIRDTEGQIVGQHEGLMYYTLGQRSGLGIGGRRGAAAEPWYVVAKDLAANVLIVGQGHDHPALFHSALAAAQLEWVHGEPPAERFRCSAKIRYRQTDQPCQVEVGSLEGSCLVQFDTPQRAITPGQSVVFYQGDTCLGGGIIEYPLTAAHSASWRTGAKPIREASTA